LLSEPKHNKKQHTKTKQKMSANVQQPAPDFSCNALMPDGTFKTLSLADYKGKWLVLFFYPLDFTFVCPTEITQYSDNYATFQSLGCEIVAASVDSEFSHLAWTSQDRKKGGLGKMNIPILADLTKKVSRDYGVLTEGAGVALRGLFLIDPKGILRQVTINDLPVGRSVEETLRLVQAFQYHEKTGDVVPCSWKPGKATMKADPKGSQEFFAQAAAAPAH